MKRLCLFFFVCLSLPLKAAWLGYDRGIAAARDGDNARATLLLTDEVTIHPENPLLLYDAGVLAYKQKEYAHAEAFFAKAVELTSSENQVHRQALFNKGNACVAEKKLHEALSAYNELLSRDPHHVQALHNRDVVKKMLEQQQQQENAQNEKQNKNKNNQQNQDKDKQQKSGDGSQQQQQEGGKDAASSEQQQSQKSGQQGQRQKGSDGEQNGQQDDGADGKQSQQQSGSSAEQQHDSVDKQQNGSGNNQQEHNKNRVDQQNSSGDNRHGEKNAEHNKKQDALRDEQNQKESSVAQSGKQDNQKRESQKSDQLDERDGYKERYNKRNAHAQGKDEQRSGADESENVGTKTDNKEGGNKQCAQQHDDGLPSQAPKGASKNDSTTVKPMKMGNKAQESVKKETKKQYAAWAESMLDAVQLNDEALNKVLVQRAVAGTLGGRDGECCW